MDLESLDTRTLGRYFEQLFVCKLLKLGFDIYTPLLDKGIDFVLRSEVDKKSRYFEVQVKSSRKKGGRLTIRKDFFPERENLFLVFFNVAEKTEAYVIPAKVVHSDFHSQVQNKKEILRLNVVHKDLEKIQAYKWNWDSDEIPELWKG